MKMKILLLPRGPTSSVKLVKELKSPEISLKSLGFFLPPGQASYADCPVFNLKSNPQLKSKITLVVT